MRRKKKGHSYFFLYVYINDGLNSQNCILYNFVNLARPFETVKCKRVSDVDSTRQKEKCSFEITHIFGIKYAQECYGFCGLMRC